MLKFWKALFSQVFYVDPPTLGAPPPGSPPPGSPPPGMPPAEKPWYDGFQDPSVKEWLGAYKDAYPGPEAVALKALNLERFVTADKAGRGVILPKADDKPEVWQAFWRKAGAAEKAEAYAVPPEFKDDPIIGKFAAHAHKINMPLQHFTAVMDWYKGEVTTMSQNNDAALGAAAEKELNEVYTEWGAERDQNVELGRRAARAMIPHENVGQLEEILHRMEGAIGTKLTMQLWANIGKGMAEHAFVSGDTGQQFGSGMTAEAARIRITQLQNDAEWSKRFAAGGADEKLEWDRLHKVLMAHSSRE